MSLLKQIIETNQYPAEKLGDKKTTGIELYIDDYDFLKSLDAVSMSRYIRLLVSRDIEPAKELIEKLRKEAQHG